MGICVLLCHGESTWNAENRFTGWTDVDLSPTGRTEAARAGQTLQDSGYAFDVAFTSVRTRAIRTLWITLEIMDVLWTPIHHSWRLNERHYGALQGLNRADTAAKYGEAQVKIWRADRPYSGLHHVRPGGDGRGADGDAGRPAIYGRALRHPGAPDDGRRPDRTPCGGTPCLCRLTQGKGDSGRLNEFFLPEDDQTGGWADR